MKKSIREIHGSRSGKASDKWDSYLGYYDQAFSAWQGEPIALLEIGVQNGGSLETYGEYFSRARHIIGCDIHPMCESLVFSDPRISVIVGNACDRATLARVQAVAPALDLVIDDGSHVSLDILNAFLQFFPILRPGGIYIIEDCHTLYDHRYGGGLLNQLSAQQFFKAMTDVVNFEWWRQHIQLPDYLASFFAGGVPPCIAEGWIDSIEFRNSIITVRKAQVAGHHKLGPRRVVGTELLVDQDPKQFQN